MQRKWLQHFCKYRHICEFLGNEGKEKEEIKEYLIQELGLPEATARYQMQRALEDEDGIVKSFGWKFYLDEEKFKAVIEDLRSIYPIRLKTYPYPPKEETEARDGLVEMKRKYAALEKAYEALRRQKVQKLEIELKGRKAPEEYEDLVFVTKNNRPTQQFIVQEGIEACVRNIQKEHPEFEKFSPHCFRHTFATRAIENGMQPKTLQKILGHGSLQMTMDLYCHVTDDTLFEAMRLMEKVV